MLILTDDGAICCDDATHGVRDMRTGRPPKTPAQLARADKRLVAMVRDWAASKRRHAHDSSRSTKDKPMPRFNAAALFQRPESRSGEAFADYIAESKMRPLDLWKKKLRDASRRVRGHAFDSGPDHAEALKHLQRMENHIDARGGTDKFDPAYLVQCFKSMLKAMTGTEEDAEDDDPTAPNRTPEDDMTAEERTRAQSGDRRRAKDGVGETPPESVVRPASRKIDHRRDFNDIAAGGADDSALAFDADALFQRVR